MKKDKKESATMREIHNPSLAKFIKQRRRELGLTLANMAERSGFHLSYWSYLESGRFKQPSATHLKSIARALGVPIEELYGLVGYEIPERLPSFRPYLRAKYQLPPEAIADLERYFEQLRAYYGIPQNEPVFPPKPKDVKEEPAESDQSTRRSS